eukprot:COSAG01_NODE_34_length_34978_cov_45.798475_28_plen_70_part_00
MPQGHPIRKLLLRLGSYCSDQKAMGTSVTTYNMGQQLLHGLHLSRARTSTLRACAARQQRPQPCHLRAA